MCEECKRLKKAMGESSVILKSVVSELDDENPYVAPFANALRILAIHFETLSKVE